MAAPSMPMVAPSGSTVEATGDDTPRLRSATRIATGKVALLDDVEKPTMIASAMPRKKGSGGSQASNRTTMRSEEHTSELQSLMRISYAVFCLKKKNKHTQK